MYGEKMYALYVEDVIGPYSGRRFAGASPDKSGLYALIAHEIAKGEIAYKEKRDEAAARMFKKDAADGDIDLKLLDFAHIEETGDTRRFVGRAGGSVDAEAMDAAAGAGAIDAEQTGAGLDIIKMGAYIYREYDAGRLNDYAAQLLLRNLPRIAAAYAHTDENDAHNDRCAAACREVLEDYNMLFEYQGYGSYMRPVWRKEALRLFDAGEQAVYAVYDRDKEFLADNRRQFEKVNYFYCVEVTGENNPYRDKAEAAEWLRKDETERRLKAFGCGYADGNGFIRIFDANDGDREIARFYDTGQMAFKPADEERGVDIEGIFRAMSEVREYVPAYLRAISKNGAMGSDYYGIAEHNGVILGAKVDGLGTFAFALFNRGYSGTYVSEWRLGSFTEAKERYAVCAGLVPYDRLAKETWLDAEADEQDAEEQEDLEI